MSLLGLSEKLAKTPRNEKDKNTIYYAKAAGSSSNGRVLVKSDGIVASNPEYKDVERILSPSDFKNGTARLEYTPAGGKVRIEVNGALISDEEYSVNGDIVTIYALQTFEPVEVHYQSPSSFSFYGAQLSGHSIRLPFSPADDVLVYRITDSGKLPVEYTIDGDILTLTEHISQTGSVYTIMYRVLQTFSGVPDELGDIYLPYKPSGSVEVKSTSGASIQYTLTDTKLHIYSNTTVVVTWYSSYTIMASYLDFPNGKYVLPFYPDDVSMLKDGETFTDFDLNGNTIILADISESDELYQVEGSGYYTELLDSSYFQEGQYQLKGYPDEGSLTVFVNGSQAQYELIDSYLSIPSLETYIENITIRYTAILPNQYLTMPTDPAVSDGDSVMVATVNGVPTVIGVKGSGDKQRALAEQARTIASQSSEAIAQVQSDIADFKSGADVDYAIYQYTDDEIGELSTTVEATYLKQTDAATTYATQSALTQTAESIEASVSQDYVSKADAQTTYATKSELTVGLDGITTSVSQTYSTKTETATAKSEAISAAASDASTKAATAKSEAISAAATDATSKAATAKSEAISAAASDATSKANAAQSAAISAAASDATSKANAAQAAAISAAATDATSKANAAQSAAEATAAADATAKANAALTDAKAYTDSVEIGGRNLWLDTSSDFLSGNPKAYSGGAHTVTTDSAYPGKEILSFTPTSDSSTGVYGFQTRDRSSINGFTVGEVYTISFDIKASDEGASVRMQPIAEAQTIVRSIAGNNSAYPITTEWTRVWCSFRVNEGRENQATCIYVNNGSGKTIYATDFKLEKGNKATEWTPAPEDMATGAEVSAIETRVSTNETNIEQNTTAIALKANSTDVYTKTQTDGLITTEVSNRNAAITAKADEITAEVSQTYAVESKTQAALDSLSVSFNETMTAQGLEMSSRLQVIQSQLDGHEEVVQDVTKSFSFSQNGLVIGASNSQMRAILDNDALRFQSGGTDVLVLDATSSTAAAERMSVGKYQWRSLDNGDSMALVYTG